MGIAALALTRDMQVFLYGTLCHAPLLRAILGRAVALRPARLSGHALRMGIDGLFPVPVPAPGRAVDGLLAAGLTEEDLARLDFHERAFGFVPQPVAVTEAEGQTLTARAYWPEAGTEAAGDLALPDWSLPDWAARWGAAVTATAADVMALFGQAARADRYGLMLVRGAARARAETEAAPARLRRAAGPGDVAVALRRQPYARFFAVEEYDLAFRRFDGSLSETVNRAVFVTGDATTVLPYDPRRDRVLLIEQFRAGPFARGAANPWLLEPIAGRIDPGETPEETARREAVEEAGLTLGALHLVARYYPTPAAKSEFLHSFVGLADLPDGIAGIAGVAAEAEDIRSHVVDYATFREIAATPEAACGPLLLTAFWLDAHRAELRAAAGADCL